MECCHNIFLDVQPTDEENGHQSWLESKCTLYLLNGMLYFNDPGAILNLYVTILRSVHFLQSPCIYRAVLASTYNTRVMAASLETRLTNCLWSLIIPQVKFDGTAWSMLCRVWPTLFVPLSCKIFMMTHFMGRGKVVEINAVDTSYSSNLQLLLYKSEPWIVTYIVGMQSVQVRFNNTWRLH